MSWNSHFNCSGAFSLPRVQSDHNPIILHTQAMSFISLQIFRFEKDWLSQEGFIDLVIKWWSSFQLQAEFGNGWRLKLQFLRQKLRGWNNNLRAEQNRQKKHLLGKLDTFEKLAESNGLRAEDIDNWNDRKMG